jgi:ureidoglycolate hydrolase
MSPALAVKTPPRAPSKSDVDILIVEPPSSANMLIKVIEQHPFSEQSEGALVDVAGVHQ